MNQEDLKKTAYLARLKLSEKEEAEFAKQLKVVFEYFKKISHINTQNTSPLVYPLEGLVSNSPLREDKAKTTNNQELFLNLAPKRQGREYKVPPVVE